ncbi:MAG: RES family NAD+ phosphorylase [Pseudomonadota bacterium]|uniref:RES family NAD+ phosphorylase n=1 Tax=Gallaecimonas pentaromativorans TaxID=584787 RepID=UPI00067F521A|nr:RES family NAD+ phosphorylase [Gallaecimonas pentaromativorans]MED5525424.1 RES family NAD+ phosphorylase [Pseudomonadota bacterium]
MDDNEIIKYVCYSCVQEDFLSDLISKSEVVEVCYYCHRLNAVILIDKLADLIESAFERHFSRTSDQPEGIECSFLADKESDYEWMRRGEPILQAIEDTAMINESIAEDILDILADRHWDMESGEMGLETEFSIDSYYELIEPDALDYQLDWQNIENSLKTSSRYFNKKAEVFFEKLFGGLKNKFSESGAPAVVTAGPGYDIYTFFRARVFHNDADIERALAHPDVELGPPPYKYARIGRMNAQGISVFYGAADPETAIAEVRPPVGSKVLVGRFDLLRTVHLVDIQSLRNLLVEGSYFDTEHMEQLKLAAFLSYLSAKMTMPIMPDDEPTEYLITQMIADYLSRRPLPGFDGILFPSVQKKGNRANVVLFNHASKVKPWELANGVRLETSVYDLDEDGSFFHYEVVEIHPPKDAHSISKEDETFDNWIEYNKISTKFDGSSPDFRDETLTLYPTSLCIHHIESISFNTSVYEVGRRRREDTDLPF